MFVSGIAIIVITLIIGLFKKEALASEIDQLSLSNFAVSVRKILYF